MVQKLPPPPKIAKIDPALNRWFLELTGLLNGQGDATLTGVPTAPTAPLLTNTNQIATTAFVIQNTASSPATVIPLMDGVGAVGVSTKYARQDHVHPTDTSRAPLASPILTGTPKAPTAVPLTDNTQIATTAYADTAVAVETTRAEAAETLLAPLASPVLTGAPTAPTAAAGTNTTQLATTAFVQARGGALHNGTGAPAAGLGAVGDWYGDVAGGVGARVWIKTGVSAWTAFPF
jgi:hypothetical protein